MGGWGGGVRVGFRGLGFRVDCSGFKACGFRSLGCRVWGLGAVGGWGCAGGVGGVQG